MINTTRRSTLGAIQYQCNALYGLQAPSATDKSGYVPVKSGRILLQLEGAEIMVRNIRIMAL